MVEFEYNLRETMKIKQGKLKKSKESVEVYANYINFTLDTALYFIHFENELQRDIVESFSKFHDPLIEFLEPNNHGARFQINSRDIDVNANLIVRLIIFMDECVFNYKRSSENTFEWALLLSKRLEDLL